MAFESTLDILFRFSAATVVGGLIGLNRELRHKPAGLRTHALVSLGAAVATSLVVWSAEGAVLSLHIDAMSRVIQGIITGIGFLGAGVILWRRPVGNHGKCICFGHANSSHWWANRKPDTQQVQAGARWPRNITRRGRHSECPLCLRLDEKIIRLKSSRMTVFRFKESLKIKPR